MSHFHSKWTLEDSKIRTRKKENITKKTNINNAYTVICFKLAGKEFSKML